MAVYNTILQIYAGAYAFGRTCSRVSVREGRKRVVRGFRRTGARGRCCSPTTTRATSRGRNSKGTSV